MKQWYKHLLGQVSQLALPLVGISQGVSCGHGYPGASLANRMRYTAWPLRRGYSQLLNDARYPIGIRAAQEWRLTEPVLCLYTGGCWWGVKTRKNLLALGRLAVVSRLYKL